ncbi:efflux RND transporter permease subunit [Vallitalea okinawensis]|uniref:efflux RND transporter permease subunit n=1 Tax=Vallitalea okinawensis TaxID=2078660 RepID=UPI000CFD68AE|nr:efflux RND transporter permease subunit [Vallitalea okinawensis]
MIDIAIKYRKITLLFVVLIVIAGMYSYYLLPKQENPDMNAPFAMVVTVYPGASPDDVKELVTDEIEEEVREITGVRSTTTESRNSVSVVLIELDNDTDVDEAWDELYRAIDEVQNQIPDECFPIEVNTDLYKTAGMMISLSSEKYNYEELEDFADSYINKLSKIDGISSFEIVGEQQKQIAIEVDIDKLNAYPLSMDDIANLIASQNVKIPAGQLDSKNGKVSVNTTGTYTSIQEIENLVILISEEDGSALRLKDIAEVYYQYSDDNFKIKQNGENGILLTAYFKDDQNILLIGDETKNIINEVSDSLPEDLNIEYVLYQPDDVSESINNFMSNLIQGIIIVIIVVLLGLGLRNAVIVSVAIPLSMTMTFLMMSVLDIKIHQISIVSLIIVLGMLVDNAIVVSDSIQVLIDQGEERFRACVKGVKMVAIPVLTSTLTTIGAFTALLMLSGLAGEFITSLPKILIIALTASYLIALFVTPTLAYIFFRPSKKKKDSFKRVRGMFDHLLEVGLKHPKKTIAIGILAMISSGFFLLGINFSLFPIADNGIIYVDIYSDGVDNIERTEEIVSQIEEVLNDQELVTTYTSSVGGPLPKFYYSMPVYSLSSDFAQMMVRFDIEGSDFKSQQVYVEHVQKAIDEKVVGGNIEAKLHRQAEPVPALKYIITGDDMDELRDVSTEIESIIRNTEGTKNVRTNYSPEEYQFYVDVNPAIAMYYGISKYDVQREISYAVAGRDISTFVYQGQEYPIMVRGDMESVDELSNYAIKSSITDEKTLLKQVADVGPQKQVTNIRTYNGDTSVTVMADIASGYNATELANQVEGEFATLHLGNMTITGDGEKASIIDLFGDVGIVAIVAIILVFGVLLIQFKSYLQPLLILVTLPLACVGSLAGLFITGQELSFTALIGMVSLIGIVVNNAIVLLDFINEERDKGKTVKDACIDAVDQRFRPIMLSSFTTVMGLIPLVLSGEILFVPMSVSLISGILVSTLLTLVFFPVIYYVAYHKQDKDLNEENTQAYKY